MPKRTSVIPTLVGTVLLLVGIGVAGNRWVQDEIPIGWRWLRSLTGPMRWELTPRDGMDVDLWVGLNLVPAVWLLVSAVFLFIATRRRDRWSFGTLFFSTWGALVGAATVAAAVLWAYDEVVLDSRLTAGPGGGLVDRFVYTLGFVTDGPIIAGFMVALVVALLGLVMGTGAPPWPGPVEDGTYAGSPVDPSPPMDPTGVMPAAPTGAMPADPAGADPTGAEPSYDEPTYDEPTYDEPPDPTRVESALPEQQRTDE